MCIRHELSAAVQTSARVSSTRRSLSESIAIDVSAFLTANVPPKPQHSSASGELDEVDPAHRAQQPQRPVADPQQPQRVAGRVVGHAVRERGADVLDAELVDQELGQLEHARPAARRRVLAHGSATHEADGDTTALDAARTRARSRCDAARERRRRA